MSASDTDTEVSGKGRFIIGLLWGLLLPFVCFILLYFIRYGAYPFRLYFRTLTEMDALTKVLSLCLLPDLAVFYVYLRSNKISTMKGLIAGVFVYVFAIVFLK